MVSVTVSICEYDNLNCSGVKARGRPRRAWTDDLKDWTQLRNYSELKRTAEDKTIWNALARQPSKKTQEEEEEETAYLLNVPTLALQIRTKLQVFSHHFSSTVLECLHLHSV